MTEKIYFRIGEVARKFDVQPSLIRYWEKEFDFINPHKSVKGTRMFTQQDIEHFEIVYHLYLWHYGLAGGSTLGSDPKSDGRRRQSGGF